MINIILNGRLGNNLFQIAAAATLAQKYNTGFRVYSGDHITPEQNSLHEYLQQYRNNILRKIEILPNKPEYYSTIYNEFQYSHSPIEYTDDMVLEGFFQSYKYFNPVLIQSLFEIDDNSQKYIIEKYGYLLNQDITSINIRRGDYLYTPENHTVCSITYFRQAINTIGRNGRFLIISDDIKWCKSVFKGNNFFFAEQENAVIDLYLQTFCKNNIISNSTFGWWGAFLNKHPDKKVIYPTPWFGIAKRSYNTKDLCPDDWTVMNSYMPLRYKCTGYYNWWRKRIDYYLSNKFVI